MKKISILFPAIILFLFFSCFSCKKTPPQLPSNRSTEQQTNNELETVNRKLVEREDKLLQDYVNKSEAEYIRDGSGFWYRITKQSNGKPIQKEQIYKISYRVYLLNGQYVEEKNNIDIFIGKLEIIKGLDIGLPLLKEGESATFIFPWTLAYGMKGDGKVPPYTSVIFDVQINKPN